jgi:peptidyl-prolyl cis-trans isomerase C
MRRWAAPAALLWLGLGLTAAGCGSKQEAAPAAQRGGAPTANAPERLDYLVRVGSSALSEEDFLASLPEEFRALLTAKEKRGYLERWVDTELLYLAALDRGLLEDAELQRRLEQQRRETIANHLLQTVLAERVQVSEGEIGDYFAAHQAEYSSEYRYREIVVRSQPEAEDLFRRLSSNAIAFSRAAEQHSLASSARGGGDLGWLAKGAMPPEVEERIARMAPQEISPPFETAWGWTLVQFRERRQSQRPLDLQDVRDEILRTLTMERRRAVYTEYLEEVQQSYPVRFHPELDQRLQSSEFLPSGRMAEESE